MQLVFSSSSHSFSRQRAFALHGTKKAQNTDICVTFLSQFFWSEAITIPNTEEENTHKPNQYERTEDFRVHCHGSIELALKKFFKNIPNFIWFCLPETKIWTKTKLKCNDSLHISVWRCSAQKGLEYSIGCYWVHDFFFQIPLISLFPIWFVRFIFIQREFHGNIPNVLNWYDCLKYVTADTNRISEQKEMVKTFKTSPK